MIIYYNQLQTRWWNWFIGKIILPQLFFQSNYGLSYWTGKYSHYHTLKWKLLAVSALGESLLNPVALKGRGGGARGKKREKNKLRKGEKEENGRKYTEKKEGREERVIMRTSIPYLALTWRGREGVMALALLLDATFHRCVSSSGSGSLQSPRLVSPLRFLRPAHHTCTPAHTYSSMQTPTPGSTHTLFCGPT